MRRMAQAGAEKLALRWRKLELVAAAATVLLMKQPNPALTTQIALEACTEQLLFRGRCALPSSELRWDLRSSKGEEETKG